MQPILRRVAAPAAIALAVVLGACGSDDSPSADDDTTSAPSASETVATDPTDSATATAPETPEATAPETPAPTPADTSAPSGTGAAPDTTEGAIARFEEFLHALGNKDVATMCEIAGPAAAIAEAEGFGPCESTFAIVVEMPSPEQSTALQTATVDPNLVDDSTAGQVIIPVEAIVADATLDEEELGDTTLAYQDGNWFIVD
ncbi:hypothetical protein [Jiangella asiatica]|uniref:Uncharacterized protein n=1 Tax=Jiangella asiatica TaxID=2530372 RepID=A0A4R5DAV7_9ACTN|nr:hypothetical protein [Jiangella asiatica]TDE08931.1 hypothetical protein E1269_16030 [Jiangella asiatica]